MIMVSRHSTLAKANNVSKNINKKQSINKEEITTQMMVQSGIEPAPKNHTNILVWTDKDSLDNFSLHLDRRLTYLRQTCPVLRECTFLFEKKDSKEADIIVIASKRHFPYGGVESAKTWTLILPGKIKINFIGCKFGQW